MSYAVDRFLEPFMRSARQCLMTRTYTALAILLLYPLRHCGATYQTEFLGATHGTEMAEFEKTKIVPRITCEISFSPNVFELIFGVNVTDFDLEVKKKVLSITNPEQLCVSVKDASLWDFDL